MSFEEFNVGFEQIEKKFSALVDRVRGLEAENKKLKENEQRVADLEKQLTDIRGQLESQSSDRTGLNERIQTLENEREQVRSRLSGLMTRLDQLLEIE